MPIKKIQLDDLHPANPLHEVIDGFNANLDSIVEAFESLNGGQGVVGPAGAKGDTGAQGPAGIQGPQGEKGDKGDTGEPGPAGKDGTNGADGKDGLPGAKGDTGAQGLKGDKGDTGAQGPAGVGIKGFASGYVDAGQFVTLDNLKFTVTTGGQRGLTVAAVAGVANLMISGTFGYVNGVGGSATTQAYTYTTTPNMTGSWFGWSFPNQGDGSVYLVNDVTNQRFYRVTLMIGPGYKNNFISIERLY